MSKVSSDQDAVVDADARAESVGRSSVRSSVIRGEPITPIGVLGLFVLTAGLGWVFGPIGLIVSIPIVLTWSVSSGPFAVAVAAITLAALPAALTPPVLAVLSIGMVAILLGDVPDTVRTNPISLAVASVSATLVLATAGYLVYTAFGAWIAPVGVVGVFSIASYGLYRYAIVRMPPRKTQ